MQTNNFSESLIWTLLSPRPGRGTAQNAAERLSLSPRRHYYDDDDDDYYPRRDEEEYDGDYDVERENWDALTDGQYGDMPEGFDGDYDFLGF